MTAELVIRNARVMTCDPARAGLGVIDHGAIAIARGEIAWVGGDSERPRGDAEIDAGGALVTPGLVDCHTHAIFAGDRAREFGMRADGKTYLEIGAAGGGIAATLGPTRAASNDELGDLLFARMDAAVRGGTTTMEVKSGYDLTADGELRLLRNIAGCSAARSGMLVPTLLAHLVPPERRADRAAFVAEIVDRWIPLATGLATSVDCYCDEGAFTLDEARAIWMAAKRAGLAVRGHVGQFADLGAAQVLAELGGLSADHLEQVSDAGIAALAGAGTVAVMLPGACVQLRLPVPPVEKLRAAGVPMAIATDLNPGSSFSDSLALQLWLATTHFGMTIEEAWLGITQHGARALGLPPTRAGSIVAAGRADLVIWNADDPAQIPYRYGANLVADVYVRGERCED